MRIAIKHEFCFDNNKQAYSIYAPNGVMKTSFLKIFKLIKQDKKGEIKDQIYPERKSVCEIKSNDIDISKENIFSIDSYDPSFNADDKASTLLANKDLREEYREAIKSIEEKQKVLEESVKKNYGINRGSFPKDDLIACFKINNKNIFDFYIGLFDQLDDLENTFVDIVYNKVFNDKTLPLLKEGQLAKELEAYIQSYNELINESPILNKKFNHYNAESIQKELGKHNFFEAEHKIILSDGTSITSIEELNKKIQQEKNKILLDKTLQEKFKAIDTKLQRHDNLRQFADYLQENQVILPELADYKNFQKTLWKNYFQVHKDKLSDFIEEYKKQKENIEKITTQAQAKQEITKWKKIIEEFHIRFKVPFIVEISNQDDVILRDSLKTSFEFHFNDRREDSGSKKDTKQDKDTLKNHILSNGEKKALYILDLLYEIEDRKLKQTKTLFIVDDIADSFDYQNKYAIIEYFYELQKEPNFYFIFLTHNFDFHRTISNRLNIDRDKRLFAEKKQGLISFVEEKYQNCPLKDWKKRLAKDDCVIIAYTPFARNLAEYLDFNNETKLNSSYKKLTSLVHLKPDTKSITIKNLEVIFKKIFKLEGKPKQRLILQDHKRKVIDVIYEVAEKIIEESKSQLEHKVSLSIAIRLKAEEYMIKKINDKSFCNSINRNQTIELIKKFKELFKEETETIKTLEKVNLMTPENIHLNSFMYEPILDMSAHHLYTLYEEVKNL